MSSTEVVKLENKSNLNLHVCVTLVVKILLFNVYIHVQANYADIAMNY